MAEGTSSFVPNNRFTTLSMKSRYTCFIEIPGHQTHAGGTLPTSVLVTNLRPDAVVIDTKKKSVPVLELNVSGESIISITHKLKLEKYELMVSDIKNHEVKVIPFEVGSPWSPTGNITHENKQTLNALHKFCKKEIKLKKCIQNISAVAVLPSKYIFNCRNEKTWESCIFILPPFY